MALGRPLRVRVQLYDYRFTPPSGVPLCHALFAVPSQRPPLGGTAAAALEAEIKNDWQVGKWWMRRKLRTLLDLTPGAGSASDTLERKPAGMQINHLLKQPQSNSKAVTPVAGSQQ
eukprot:GHVT01063562.1.p1 GENE.GHVT01063562.1~~GHVT01063562.1.p1  ORF type:complete len:116 (-),score=20.27 GHVT01063562.1:1207-1554(-)